MKIFYRYKVKAKNFGKKILKNILLSKTFPKLVKYFIVSLVVVLVLLSVYLYLQKTISGSVIVSESEILNKVNKQVVLPQDGLMSVKRVQDSATLRIQNDFYKEIKDGDYIISYKNKIIIYDFMKDKVVAQTK